MSFEDFMAAFPAQEKQTSKHIPASDDTFFIDTGDVNAQRLRAARTGVEWHNNVRDIVASMVSAGVSDEIIAALAPTLTLDGYTVDQTKAELRPMIRGARQKGFGEMGDQPVIQDGSAIPKILTLIDDIELTDPQYLIDGLIEEQSLIGLIGPSGSGKTFVALDMALSLATGTNYHGSKASKGLVVISAGEGHKGIPRRVQAWRVHHDKERDRIPVALTNRAADLFDPASLNSFCAEVDELIQLVGAPKLMIIDTVARHMGGKDENNAQDMGELVKTADKLKETYKCAIMLVHHTGHSNQDRARGSTAFKGALDTEILVKPKGEHDLIMSCEKQKDGPEFDQMQFVKVSVEPAVVLQQVEISRRKTKLSEGEQLAMDTFYEATKRNVASAELHIDEWRPLFNQRHTGDNQKSKNTAFSRARLSLTQKGLLKCSDDIYSLGDKAT
ncbi:helicase RepA family protein [bacterium]|nr:helicase RepA family protein [bacterium]